MSNNDPTVESITDRQVDGGDEITVVIFDPTPAGIVAETHGPDTLVVPADATDSAPVEVGTVNADTPVVTPPAGEPTIVQPASSLPTTPDGNDPAAPVPTQPAPETAEPIDVTPSGHPADTPTTTAGEVGNSTPVVRPDDPEATPTPADDLPPGTVVFDPGADLTKAPTAPITTADLTGLPFPITDASTLLAALDTASLSIVRK